MIYTKPKCEKKVSSGLKRKKIENFLPLTFKEIQKGNKWKLIQRPVFNSYVFAFLNIAEIEKVKSINGVINIVYWKKSPAIIRDSEIVQLKDFISVYEDISVEKTTVSFHKTSQIFETSADLIADNLVRIRNSRVKVNFPSLGYSLVGNIKSASILKNESAFDKKNIMLQ